MPKKTKKEKILALYHRKIRLLENKQTTSTVAVLKTPINSVPATSITNIEPTTSPSNQYFFSDLKKSLILITLIIGLEISLYFAKLIK